MDPLNELFQRILLQRQEAPDVFDMNVSFYTHTACEHLKAGYGALEGYNELILMYDTAVLDLDHENDFYTYASYCSLFIFKPIKNSMKFVVTY